MICRYSICDKPVYKFIMPLIKSNMYVILSGRKALIIDPNVNEAAMNLLEEHNVEKIVILLTHEHYDHISGVNYFRDKWNCTVYGNKCCKERCEKPEKNLAAYFMALFIGRSEEERQQATELFQDHYHCTVDRTFERKMELEFGQMKWELVSTPGHSSGSICILVENALFSGDSLVQGAKVITRMPDGDRKAYQMITRPFLESLPQDTIVFPGHGQESIMSELELG